MRSFILVTYLAWAACGAQAARPSDAAELYGRGGQSRSSKEYPAGPAVYVKEVDGRPVNISKAVVLSPGLHRIRIIIVVLDVEANPEIEFWAEANHKYEIFAAYHGYTEFHLFSRDITSSPAVGIFAAVVPKSNFSPQVKYFDGPHRPKSAKLAEPGGFCGAKPTQDH